MNKHRGSTLEEWLESEGLHDIIETSVRHHNDVMMARLQLLQLLAEWLSSDVRLAVQASAPG
jgi:hypothetical protein